LLIISYFAARIYIIGLAILYQEHFREFIVLGRGSPFTWEAGGNTPCPPPLGGTAFRRVTVVKVMGRRSSVGFVS
jgi:hypothetical protein